MSDAKHLMLPPSEVHPLYWWRCVNFADLGPNHARELALVLEQVEMFGERRWRDAKSGDAVSAIGCALGCMPISSVTPMVDAAMAAVLLCALKGDAAARLIVTQYRKAPSTRSIASERSPRGTSLVEAE